MALESPATSESVADDVTRVRLVRGGGIVFEASGFRVIQPRGLKRSPLQPYESVGHIHAAPRMLFIGTADSLAVIRRADFIDREAGPETARRIMLDQIGARPGGEVQLREIEAVERLGERDGPAWAVWITAALCLLGTALQIANPMVEQVGAFLPELFSRGEFWRAITAHFIHAPGALPGPLRPLLPMVDVVPVHLALNVAGMLVLGHLVERPLGAFNTAIVLTLSGIGSMVGIVIAGHVNVVGASGLVAGLAGAMLAMELHYPRALPSFWRLPRRLFIGVILIQFVVIDQLFASVLAGGAHLGGFAGGYVAAWLIGRPGLEGLTPAPSQIFAAGCIGMLLVVGFFGAWPLARSDMAALERHAVRLLDSSGSVYLYPHDNAAAWLIATEGGASHQGLDLAVALADRAVTNTGRMQPDLLDTLAEALFQRGDRLGAVLTIEEAIRLQPWEPYFFEQRRRFVGERDPDDRPPPPGSEPWSEIPYDELFEPLPIGVDAPRVTI